MSKGPLSRAWEQGYAAGYAAAHGGRAPADDGAPTSAQTGWEPLLADLERGRIVLLRPALVRRYRAPRALKVSIARAARRRGFRVESRLSERGLAVRRVRDQGAEAVAAAMGTEGA